MLPWWYILFCSALPGAGVLPGLGAAVPGGAGLVSAGGIPSHLQPRLGGTLNDNSALPRPNALGAADAHSSVPENNPLKDLIRQLQNTPQVSLKVLFFNFGVWRLPPLKSFPHFSRKQFWSRSEDALAHNFYKQATFFLFDSI